MIQDKKIGIFIDGISLYHGLDGVKISFTKFKQWVATSGTNNSVADGYYFNCVEDVLSKRNFFSHVNKSGFKLFISKAKYNSSLGKLDMSELTINLIDELTSSYHLYDKIIIVSGKRDLFNVCELITSNNKELEIIGFHDNIYSGLKKFKIRYVEDFIIS